MFQQSYRTVILGKIYQVGQEESVVFLNSIIQFSHHEKRNMG